MYFFNRNLIKILILTVAVSAFTMEVDTIAANIRDIAVRVERVPIFFGEIDNILV